MTTKIKSGVIAAGAIDATALADNSITIAHLDCSDGTNGQVLTTDGSGTLSFSTISGYTDSDVETYLNTSMIYTDATNDRLGIGTSSPAEPLHVQEGSSGITSRAGTIALIEGSGNTKVSIASGTTSTGQLLFGSSADNDAGRIIYDHSDDGLQVWTNGSRAVDIDSSGNVGIGTTSPDNTLMVQGASTNGASSSGNVALFEGPSGTNGLKIFVDDAENAAGLQTIAGDDLLLNPHNGNVGIGTTSPTTELHIASASPVLTLQDTDSTEPLSTFIAFKDNGGAQHGYIGYGSSSSDLLQLVNSYDDIVMYTGSSGTSSERMRIESNGFTKHSNTGVYDTYVGADDSHQFVSNNATHSTLWVTNTSTSTNAGMLRLESARGPSSAFSFLAATTGNLTDDQFILRGDGNAYADGSWNGGGADYAEYFEWSDGNTANEDRRGYTVVLSENKIRKSTSEDNPNNIIGVVSGNPSVIGDSDIGSWKNKYQKDDYGSYIKDANGDRVINDEYDETQDYISREDRQEWDIIGLMGKVRINKGQTVGDRWIKMRDISDTVEEWLIK